MHYAVQGSRTSIVKALTKNEANVNAADEDKRTSLYMATQFHRKEIVKILMEARADVHAADKYGITPLHFAEGAETVKTLIEAGANVNAVDKNTPLHIAAKFCLEEVIETLIEKRADFLSKNNDNKIPSDFDENHYIIRRVKLLWFEERMKQLDQQNKIFFVAFSLTILFGTAIAITLFVTETVTAGLYPIIGAVVIVAAAWVVSCATAKILEPNTKIDETKGIQVNGDMPKVTS